MLVTPARLVQALGQWHVRSQQVARRNALVASTALAERRREIAEVEEFLAARAGDRKTIEVPVRTTSGQGA